MKKISALLLIIVMVIMTTPAVGVNAQSLDDLIGGEASTEYVNSQPNSDTSYGSLNELSFDNIYSNDGNSSYIDEMKDATNLSAKSEGATRLNAGIKKVASFMVQVLSYFATVCLVVRVLLDIVYIVIPFTRSFLANGHTVNAQANGMQQPGMGGMGSPMGGMGMGGMGMGGYGHSRYGMGGMGMGSMGMGGMGMNSMQQGMRQPGAMQAFRVQWISTAALKAVADEAVIGPNGKAVSPLRTYAKDMLIALILAPVFLVLAVTGTLTDLGFLIGEMIATAISGIGGMI